VAEYPTLRASVAEHDHGTCQVFHPADEWRVPLIDLSDALDPEESARVLMAESVSRPVDVGAPPLFEVALIKISDKRYFWFEKCHHILADGFTGSLTVRRIAENYDELVAGRGGDIGADGRSGPAGWPAPRNR
jgi:hypothetical protein